MTTVAAVEFALIELKSGVCEAVILEAGDVYVQAAMDGHDNFRVEAISDQFLPERLTPDQLRQLVDRKFRAPSKHDGPNNWQQVPADPKAAAELLADTLISVYGQALADAQIVRP
ncbi:MAG: hypothetical protein ABI577_14855 [bacterium]